MKTQIIFEDKDIIVCYKPAGIAVQTASIGQQDMVSELKNDLAHRPGAGNINGKEPYIGVVHRLDQPVSGVVVFAKNRAAAASLSAQIQDGRAGKVYHALVCGSYKEGSKEGMLENILVKNVKTNTSYVVKEDSKEAKQGKKAKLSYRVLEELSVDGMPYSKLEIKLYTGRHHQIRVQLSHSGHPILGDAKYGTPETLELSTKLEKGLKLCAYTLSFIHPKTGKEVTYTAPFCF